MSCSPILIPFHSAIEVPLLPAPEGLSLFVRYARTYSHLVGIDIGFWISPFRSVQQDQKSEHVARLLVFCMQRNALFKSLNVRLEGRRDKRPSCMRWCQHASGINTVKYDCTQRLQKWYFYLSWPQIEFCVVCKSGLKEKHCPKKVNRKAHWDKSCARWMPVSFIAFI